MLRTIRPYAADSFPKAFVEPDCAVIAIDAERTFWEKATILHQEAHRPGNVPARYSRHYYDLYKLAGSPIRDAALANRDLLQAVVEFKERFLLFFVGTLRRGATGLVPAASPEKQRYALERDYRAMRDMFYKEPPTFGEILDALQVLENEINAIG